MKRWAAAAGFTALCSLALLEYHYNLRGLANFVVMLAATFWLLRELTDEPVIAGFGSGLLALQLGQPDWANAAGVCAAVLGSSALIVSVVFRKAWLHGVGAAATGLMLWAVARSVGERHYWWSQDQRVDVILSLSGLAVFAWLTRKTSRRSRTLATPTDRPATKSSMQLGDLRSRRVWIVLAVCLAAFLLFVPVETDHEPRATVNFFLLAGSGMLLALRGYRRDWTTLFTLIALLFLPDVLSSPVPTRELVQLSVPGLGPSPRLAPPDVQLGLLGLLALSIAGYDRRLLLVAGWGLPLLALITTLGAGGYLLALALRSLLTGTMALILFERCLNALSRPALQAPPRLSPAPGSLPRP